MLQSYCTTVIHGLTDYAHQVGKFFGRKLCVPRSRCWQLDERPPLNQLASLPRHQLPRFVQEAPVACHYLDWLGLLDWSHFPESRRLSAQTAPYRGPVPQPTAPYVAAFLVKVDRQLPHMAQLRQFLSEQPALVWLFGFPLVASTAFPWGFDVATSLPAHRHFNRVLRHLPNADLQFLLSSSLDLLRPLLPPDILLGDAISLDTKHIIAWVKENNPKEFIKGGRFHKARQPTGDPDCKVGFKANANQASVVPKADGTPGSKARVGEYYWVYASGLVATKVPHWGEVVLAEKTLPFDHGELSYFLPPLCGAGCSLRCFLRLCLFSSCWGLGRHPVTQPRRILAPVRSQRATALRCRLAHATQNALSRPHSSVASSLCAVCVSTLLSHSDRYPLPHRPQKSGERRLCDGDAHQYWYTPACTT